MASYSKIMFILTLMSNIEECVVSELSMTLLLANYHEKQMLV